MLMLKMSLSVLFSLMEQDSTWRTVFHQTILRFWKVCSKSIERGNGVCTWSLMTAHVYSTCDQWSHTVTGSPASTCVLISWPELHENYQCLTDCSCRCLHHMPQSGHHHRLHSLSHALLPLTTEEKIRSVICFVYVQQKINKQILRWNSEILIVKQ